MSVEPKRHALIELAISRPRVVLWVTGALTVVFALLTAVVGLDVDTDPENMLPSDHEVRQRNEEMREQFGTHEMIVVGIVDDDGLTTPEVMTATDELAVAIGGYDGVVGGEVVSFSGATGGVADVGTADGVDRTMAAVATDPVLAGNVIADDGTALAIFVPLEDKSDANPVTADIEAAIAESPILDVLETHVAGLPLAEEAFGEEMFLQMGLFAPLAGLLIFLLMLYFFRKISLVMAGMITALLAVVWTMGLLIGTGNTLHIMSSMIPIFLMPIAILDSIHVLSEFFDRYPHILDRRETLRVVYGELFKPITFTTITTGVAFASLALAPIPPVRVFGLFVAFGVGAAWLLSMVFIPAYIMVMNERRLAHAAADDHPESSDKLLNVFLRAMGRFTLRRRVPIMVGFAVLGVLAVPAITRITVNDNPVNWFKPGSDVRVATEELNERLPGTFNANLLVQTDDGVSLTDPEVLGAVAGIQAAWESVEIVGSSASYADLVAGATGTGAAEQLTLAAEESPLVASLVTDDRTSANIRLQLSDGDNQAMRAVVDATDDHLADRPLPDGVRVEWAGETYLNLVWQDEMVSGMLTAFLSTLVVVLVLMAVLFRSVKWALLSVLPVLWTVLVVYGALGLVGKDYDMPIAVLSTLVLGIGVDFAIHFVQRFRELDDEFGDSRWAVRSFFEEPARALTRNALVIAIGFTPLFFASLVPYLVVGAFLSSIIVLSWLATLLLLPAVVGGRAQPDSATVTATASGGTRPVGGRRDPATV